MTSSASDAWLPEVRHLAAPWKEWHGRRPHRKLVTRHPSLVTARSGAACGREVLLFGRGWKPHLRKRRLTSSASDAGLPGVRHLAAPWKECHGRRPHRKLVTRHPSLQEAVRPAAGKSCSGAAGSRTSWKWRMTSSTSIAGLPEVRHLAAPWKEWRGRRPHRKLVTRHSSLRPAAAKSCLGAAGSRTSWKWRMTSSASDAGLPEVRHLAAPWKECRGKMPHRKLVSRHPSLVTALWGALGKPWCRPCKGAGTESPENLQ